VHYELRELADAAAVARAGAAAVLAHAERAVAEAGVFHLAVSGGRTPWQMLDVLTTLEMPWRQTVIYQVDERLAPDGDPQRNLTSLQRCLSGRPVTLHPMDVTDADPVAAAAAYARLLPAWFDLVHLGLGADGHTASLVPGDPVLTVTDRLVALTARAYQGRRRMTLTYPALARARHLLWLVTGAEKRAALAALLLGERAVPAGRVSADQSSVLADSAAVTGQEPTD
jgi:6-phosphogluconolactonase